MTESKQKIFIATKADNEGDFSTKDWSLFLGISLIWGSSFLLMAEAIEALRPGVVTFGRASLGALTLWVIRLISYRGKKIDSADRARIYVLGALWVAIPFTLFPLAQQSINSAVTGLLNGATPVLATLVSVILVRVKPRGKQLLGLLVGFAGIVLVSLGSAGQGSSEAKGVAMVLLATVCYGFALNIAPPLQAKYGGIVLMSNVLTVATVLVTPYALYKVDENQWQTSSSLSILFLGAVGTGLAYLMMSNLVGRVGSIRASFITYLIPVVSLVLGVLLRNDTVTTLTLIGAPITIVGAYLASKKQR